MIERLHFGSDVRYSGLEASIHLARYQLAREFSKGRRVLDIACGEGYGSAWLKQWGATQVDGVDVSIEAVQNARGNFGQQDVNFHVYDAESVSNLFAGRKFDLIVSLETIEHLSSPERYLQSLKALLADDGIIIISCPNDWWYFPTGSEGNPYHVRKYRFEEFCALTTSVLGEPNQWGIGTAIAGFVNMDLQSMPKAAAQDDQRVMMASQPLQNAYVVPAEADDQTVPENCSYFFGVWGTNNVGTSTAVLPVSMDIFRNGMYAGQSSAADNSEPGAQRARVDVNAYEAHLREARLRIAALVTENAALKENMEKVRFAGREADMAVSYWRAEWEQLLQRYEALRGGAGSATSQSINDVVKRAARKLRTALRKG